MVDQMTEYSLGGHEVILPFGIDDHPNAIGWYEFDYAAPGENEDATVNKIQIGDLVYVESDKVKKLRDTTTNATLQATEFGIVVELKDDAGNFKYSDPTATLASDTGITFTADGGEVGVMFGKFTIPWFASKVFIHTVNVSTDTRVPFALATHAGSGDVLEGLVAPAGKVGGAQTYVFK